MIEAKVKQHTMNPNFRVSKKLSFAELNICRIANNIISISSQLAVGSPLWQNSFFRHPVVNFQVFCGSDALGSLRHNLPQACRKTSTTLGNNRIVDFFFILIYFLFLVCTILFQKLVFDSVKQLPFTPKRKKRMNICSYLNILDIYLCR